MENVAVAPADTARLFIALWPDPQVRHGLRAWRDAWTWPSKATPVRAERLHMTLHFLGSLPRASLPALTAGLHVPFVPFALEFGHAALWKHGIAVIEPERIPLPLLQLQAALAEALLAMGLPAETRPFRPHITVARRAERALPPVQGPPPVRWSVAGYALMESRPGAAGGYTVLRSFGEK